MGLSAYMTIPYGLEKAVVFTNGFHRGDLCSDVCWAVAQREYQHGGFCWCAIATLPADYSLNRKAITRPT